MTTPLDKAVEAAAESLWNEREFANPSGPPPWNWCPPGEAPDHKPPRSPALWHTVVAAGEYPASVEETREEVRQTLQAADDLLREHYWGELRERLEVVADELDSEADDCQRWANNHPKQKDAFDAQRDGYRDSARRLRLATTQKEEL